MATNEIKDYTPTPEDFKFVQIDEKIFDTKFETRPIGYLEDAFIRFKKNKASVVAFIILSIIILLAIFGPMLSKNKADAVDDKIALLPPRIPLLEKIGIADGTRVFLHVDTEQLDKNADYQQTYDLGNNRELKISGGFPVGSYKIIKGPYTDPNDVNNRQFVDIRADLYKVQFGERELKTLTEMQFKEIQDKGAVISFQKFETCVTKPGKGKVCDNVYYDATVNYLKLKGYNSTPYLLFGTDQIGRDMWTRLWTGTRVSLIVGLSVAIITITIGTIYGSISGYYGGMVDLLMQRFIEILTGVPWIVIMTLIILYMGNNLTSITIALTAVAWTGTSSIVRSQIYRYKGREFVLASRTLGAKDLRLIFKHILPNGIGPIVTSSVLIIPSAIFTESVISYLNLGLGSGVSIGVLLNNGQSVLTSYPYLTVFPAIIISLLMITFNLFGNGLRDALNPSLRGAE